MISGGNGSQGSGIGRGLSALEKAQEIRRNSGVGKLPGLNTEASAGSLDNSYGQKQNGGGFKHGRMGAAGSNIMGQNGAGGSFKTPQLNNRTSKMSDRSNQRAMNGRNIMGPPPTKGYRDLAGNYGGSNLKGGGAGSMGGGGIGGGLGSSASLGGGGGGGGVMIL